MKTILAIALFLTSIAKAGELGKFEDPDEKAYKQAPAVIQQKAQKRTALDDFQEKVKDLDCDSMSIIVASIEEKVLKAKTRDKKLFLAKAYVIVTELAIRNDCEE